MAGSRKSVKPQYSMIRIFAGSGTKMRQSARAKFNSNLDFHMASSTKMLDSLSS